jgi:hypothetical protein
MSCSPCASKRRPSPGPAHRPRAIEARLQGGVNLPHRTIPPRRRARPAGQNRLPSGITGSTPSIRSSARCLQDRPARRRKASTAIRRSVPIRTFSDWDNSAPGFVEADLISHSGPFAKGAFTQTLVLTDIASGWTECAPLLVREQTVLTTALTELRKLLPFPLLGFDTDNDSVFMNETVRGYCLRDGIELTRCRPYRKNDQAFVEQKNGAIVRRIVGYRRFEGLIATHELAKLYALTRLFINFFQRSLR